MSTIKVSFCWSENARRNHFNLTGDRLPWEGSVEFDMAQATPEQRNAMPLSDSITVYSDLNLNTVASLDEAPSLDQVIAMLRAHAAAKRMHAEQYTADMRASAERRAAADAERAEYEARVAAKNAALEAEKLAWIETNGSASLRRAAAAGYDCQRKYVTERAALEAPGFEVDFDDVARWKSRACPSIAALDIEDSVTAGIGNAKTVWLTDPPHKLTDEYENGFEACEAVVIRSYLGKYDLVRIV